MSIIVDALIQIHKGIYRDNNNPLNLQPGTKMVTDSASNPCPASGSPASCLAFADAQGNERQGGSRPTLHPKPGWSQVLWTAGNRPR